MPTITPIETATTYSGATPDHTEAIAFHPEDMIAYAEGATSHKENVTGHIEVAIEQLAPT